MITYLKAQSKYALLFCSLAITGCSTTAMYSPKDKSPDAFIDSTQAKQQLTQTLPCCTNLQQLTYQPLLDDKVRYSTFDKSSEVYQFESGKSFYNAFKINNNISNVSVSGLVYNTVFVPQILVLDSKFNPTRIISTDSLNYKEAKRLNGDELTTSFNIQRSDLNPAKNETYFIIYTTTAAMQMTSTVTHPAKLDARARNVVEPNIPDPIIDHSAMGVVKLQFKIEQSNHVDNMQESQIKEVEVNNSITEAQFNQLIIDAVAENKMEAALELVEQAEKAGSSSARSTFLEAIKK